jgi:hypothetical protein
MYSTGAAYYVSSVIGSDANAGKSRLYPKATLASAISAATDDDIIVLAADHAETLTSTQDIDHRLVIVAEGSSSGKPTCKFTNNQDAVMFDITADDVQLRNIWFEEESTANTNPRVRTDMDRTQIIGCYFEADANSNTDGVLEVNTGASNLIIKNTTFVSTSASGATPPVKAIDITAAMDGLTGASWGSRTSLSRPPQPL